MDAIKIKIKFPLKRKKEKRKKIYIVSHYYLYFLIVSRCSLLDNGNIVSRQGHYEAH